MTEPESIDLNIVYVDDEEWADALAEQDSNDEEWDDYD